MKALKVEMQFIARGLQRGKSRPRLALRNHQLPRLTSERPGGFTDK
jgi:hypothetical protein